MSWQPPETRQAQALKIHRAAELAITDDAVWTDITFDTVVDSETTPDFSLLSSDAMNTIQSHTTGIFYLGGCIHPKWNGVASSTPTLAVRIVSSTNGTDWNEKRCLQSLTQKARGSAEFDTMHYLGTVSVVPDELLKLQVYTSSTDLVLIGSSDVFENPVAASLAIYGGQLEV
ncbi:hypothetical protein IH575_03970 [Candidatus Dojkabacteria bacterium]|nr:hypothetical protein [Candidatus Dojkabacteria bacterium]